MLNGWHFGERIIHQKHGTDKDPQIESLVFHINGDLDPEHALFHSSRIPFLPVTTLDKEGRPWGSILAAEDGLPGNHFIRNSKYTTLAIRAKVWEGEPFLENAKLFKGGKEGEERMLIAGIGLEFSTRRRNKLAGWVSKLEQKDSKVFELELIVNQSLGNCPKYITTRQFVPYLNTKPSIKYQKPQLPSGSRLPDEVIAFIHNSDTVFIGTTYAAPTEDAKKYPSHVGMNQRGGRKGYIRVSPSDGRTVVVPDYSGNRFLTSLGNIEASPLASLTFVSFTTGSILYITGEAHNHVGEDAKRIMPFHNGTLSAVKTTGYTFVEDALPVRLAPGSSENPSPYSPPISYLADEPQSKGTKLFNNSDSERTTAHLSRIQLHSPSIATFTWETSRPIEIEPGQAIIMDFSTLLGQKQYQHMANHNPKSVNDDRIRTWTVSSSSSWRSLASSEPHSSSSPQSYTLTMREQPGGLVTGALFSISRRIAETRPELLDDPRPLDIRIGIVGVSGGFGMPKQVGGDLGVKKFLWIAGGIGITPFLSMLRAPFTVRDGGEEGTIATEWDVRLILSTGNPEVIIPLILSAYQDGVGKFHQEAGDAVQTSKSGLSRAKAIRLLIDVYSSSSSNTLDLESLQAVEGINIRMHTGRVPSNLFSSTVKEDAWGERDAYLCGPKQFEDVIVEDLVSAGVVGMKRETFAY
ncbi:hypothetical protein D9758_011331 [Tetrapyrgos nigripes]|uniref:FAD-binding FR-type domain-containing protein n=1 Tax=Tetrapyrgos nigripes TaxID=182062 RepID=A0A8H5G883_9AGAR|nr:hypothetical protein D9758_011331 [Tetrapyrgos nigripes]